MRNFQRTYVLPLLILISGIFLVYYVDHKIEETELEKRGIRIEKETNTAIAEFRNGVNKLAVLTSGIRSYIESSPDIPSKENLQSYLKTQFEYLSSNDSLVVSFIDTNHIFQYSVTPNSLSPNKLNGSSVKKLRDTAAIARLEKLLTYKEFRLFPPINMVEGYVGIPLNFRVAKDGKAIGYIASLINFKSIIDDLYLNNNADDFVYHFLTVKGDAFDRVAYYDGSKIYNDKEDVESFKMFDIKKENFSYSSFSIFGYQYQVGVALKKPYERSWILIGSVISWLTCLVVGVLFLLQYQKAKIKGKDQVIEMIENELNKKNEALANFKYISSHDLKEPLRSLVSFSMILKKRYKDELDDNAKNYLEYIISSASQMNNVLDDLIKFTKLSESTNLPKKEVDLNQTIKDIQFILAPMIKDRNLDIIIGYLPIINANPEWIRLLYKNLISNAIKFNDKPDPAICIGSREMEGELVFFVKDNGIGIAKEYHGKILQLFHRLSKKGKGTGVGLAVCKKIIETYNGKIWVKSDKAKTTTFYFTLPDCMIEHSTLLNEKRFNGSININD